VPDRSASPLARDAILDTTESVLRRHGPAKTTVLDVSRALGVSHGTVYRHFPTKAALVEAVTERWLAQVIAPLAAIADGGGPALPRIRDWFDSLTTSKRRLAHDDPELFETYVALMEQAPEMVQRHTGALLDQLTSVVADGARRGEIVTADPPRTARAAFHAMSRFHNPLHRRYWSDPELATHYEAVWELVAAGLSAGKPNVSRRRRTPS
jgi:AcrR family transcriptional regulator